MSPRENLADAFAGDSEANRRYLAFAKQAEVDGFPLGAKLFRAAAHLRAMGGIKQTAENLREGDGMAEVSFRNALTMEEIHHKLYSHAIATVQADGDLPARQVYVCEICGNTVYDGFRNAARSVAYKGIASL